MKSKRKLITAIVLVILLVFLATVLAESAVAYSTPAFLEEQSGWKKNETETMTVCARAHEGLNMQNMGKGLLMEAA